jgi:hypothetical protein
MGSAETWDLHLFTLLSGKVGFKNGIAAIRLGTGKVVPGALEADLFVIGTFAETIDASSGDKQVNIDLGRKIVIDWYANSGTSPIAATDVGMPCYIQDDQTVSIAPNGGSLYGRVWGVETVRGVAVERLGGLGSGGGVLPENTLTAFSSNNTNAPVDGGIYDVPTTAAASTVTLSASAKEGTVQYFVADGTKNGHTVTYRDATGPVSLTTALTASKRHLVIATFLNGLWNANAYVSP